MTRPLRAVRAIAPAAASAGSRPVVSGLSLAMIAAGVLLIVAGTHRSPVADVLKAAIKGEPIPKDLWYQDPTLVSAQTGQTATLSAAITTGSGDGTGSALGRQVAAYGISYVGKVPYKFGGNDPSGWDCSGFVTWVLNHNGVAPPNTRRPVTGDYYIWSGATTVPRNQCQTGDLVCWLGHIGIATDSDHMVNAANPKDGTLISKIWAVPAPVIRRPKAYTATGVAAA